MSQNVFADMELPNPDERLLKAEIILKIRQIVENKNLTQAQIAVSLGMTQPGISRMLRGMAKDISVEKLLRVLVALGYSVKIVIDTIETPTAGATVEFATAA